MVKVNKLDAITQTKLFVLGLGWRSFCFFVTTDAYEFEERRKKKAVQEKRQELANTHDLYESM